MFKREIKRSAINNRNIRKPQILIDIYEKDEELKRAIYYYSKNDIEIGFKTGGSGDYIIIDRYNNIYGIERKTFSDCYLSIIKKDADNKTSRIYGQLAQLKNEYGKNAFFLLELSDKKIFLNAPNDERKILEDKIKRIVFTFFSERSLIMPCFITIHQRHTAFLIVKLANKLPDKMDFKGRGFIIKPDFKINNKGT